MAEVNRSWVSWLHSQRIGQSRVDGDSAMKATGLDDEKDSIRASLVLVEAAVPQA
jgi:hypothetical protein